MKKKIDPPTEFIPTHQMTHMGKTFSVQYLVYNRGFYIVDNGQEFLTIHAEDVESLLVLIDPYKSPQELLRERVNETGLTYQDKGVLGKIWKADNERAEQRFRDSVASYYGVEHHVYLNEMWKMAWDRGHSAGYSEVLSEFSDIASELGGEKNITIGMLKNPELFLRGKKEA